MRSFMWTDYVTLWQINGLGDSKMRFYVNAFCLAFSVPRVYGMGLGTLLQSEDSLIRYKPVNVAKLLHFDISETLLMGGIGCD